MSAEELAHIALFDGLTPDQRGRLWDAGTEWAFAPGDVPFHEGRPADFWWVLLEGSLTLSRRVGHQETELGVMSNPGQWAGGFQAWDAHGVYMATARGVLPGRMLKVPAEALGDVRALDQGAVHLGVRPHGADELRDAVRRLADLHEQAVDGQ